MTDKIHDAVMLEIKELRKDMNSGFEKMTDKISDNNVTLGIQAEQLKEHMRRTNILEEAQKEAKEKLELDLEPLQDHVAFVNNGLRLAGVISAILVFALTVKELFF